MLSAAKHLVWSTNLVTLGVYLHRSRREQLALPLVAALRFACWSTMYVNRRGHDVGNPYTDPSQSLHWAQRMCSGWQGV